MGRPKLGAEYKKPSDYTYDYPANREIGKWITWKDKAHIAAKTGYTRDYVNDWCVGRRRNDKIESLARIIAKLNQAKQRKLEKLEASSK